MGNVSWCQQQQHQQQITIIATVQRIHCCINENWTKILSRKQILDEIESTAETETLNMHVFDLCSAILFSHAKKIHFCREATTTKHSFVLIFIFCRVFSISFMIFRNSNYIYFCFALLCFARVCIVVFSSSSFLRKHTRCVYVYDRQIEYDRQIWMSAFYAKDVSISKEKWNR